VHLLSPSTRPLSFPSSTTTYAAQIPNSASSAHSSVEEVKAMMPSRCVPHSRCCIQRRVSRLPSIWTITAQCSSYLTVSTRKNPSLAGALFLVGIPLVLVERLQLRLGFRLAQVFNRIKFEYLFCFDSKFLLARDCAISRDPCHSEHWYRIGRGGGR